MKIISEKTLYKYIFCPSALSEDQRLFILQNSEEFREDLALLRAIKSGLENELPETILDKIHKKIINESAKDGIKLNLIPQTESDGKCVLAADSVKSETKQKTYSFIDESNNYLIKVINKDAENKIYIFTKVEVDRSRIFSNSIPLQRSLLCKFGRYAINNFTSAKDKFNHS